MARKGGKPVLGAVGKNAGTFPALPYMFRDRQHGQAKMALISHPQNARPWTRLAILNMHNDRSMNHPIIAMPTVLTAQDVCFSFPERTLLSHWSASIPAGVTLVRGGEGSGKSVLLRLLAGDFCAHAGDLRIRDVNLRDHPSAYRQQVFWADSRSDAFDQITPTAYFSLARKRYPMFDQQVLDELITDLSLELHVNKQLFMLSTGSKRKVWLAAAFASGATVTLLDEPFAALDKASIGVVMARLGAVASDASRAYVVAHYEEPGNVPLAAVIDLGD
jgi:ABC-type transport system involved in cytochrome c biogenesis ATPase subunit